MIDYNKQPRTTGSPVSLSKVNLTKAAPSVSLTKQGSATGQLRVNLNWNARPTGGGGFFKRLSGAGGSIDLDLGCLYELADGERGCIQALGGAFGALEQPPYCYLDGDDRSGAVAAGENLLINLAHVREIRRVLVFAYIYEGASRFDEADGVVTLHPASGPQIEVRLDESAGDARMCAIALLENRGGELTVRREVNFLAGNQLDLDRAYGWGMEWTAGSK